MGRTSKRRGLGVEGGLGATQAPEHSGSSELTVRLWTGTATDAGLLSWKSDYPCVHLIADLLIASDGLLLADSPDGLLAKFEVPHLAILASKRIQWALLGFAQDPQSQPAFATIAVTSASQPSHSEAPPAHGVVSALSKAKPGQVLVAESIYKQLNGVPGLEFGAKRKGGVRELLWAPPDVCRQLECVVDQEPKIPPAPATADPMSAPGLLGPSTASVAPDIAPTPDSNVRADSSIPPAVAGQYRTMLPGKIAGIRATVTNYTSKWNWNLTRLDWHSSKFRIALVIGGIVLVSSGGLLWTATHKSIASHVTVAQKVTAQKTGTTDVTTVPVAFDHPTPPAPPRLDEPSVPKAADSTPPKRSTDAPEPKKQDALRGKRPAALPVEASDGKATAGCQLLPNDISAYLDRADRNRAKGNYTDAIREYGAVIDCDRHNAKALQGLAKTKQAQSVSGDRSD